MLPDFSKSRILVVGDVMLDRYWHGGTSRISPEAPVPVVNIQGEELRPGGAANVALNIAALGGQVTLIGHVGVDEEAKKLQSLLESNHVQCEFVSHASCKTITKLRVISRQQQLIRLDFEDSPASIGSDQLIKKFEAMVSGFDLVILSDYGKGAVSAAKQLISIARNAGLPVFVDPKGTDFQRYENASYITPNFSEFVAVVGNVQTDAEIEQAAKRLIAKLNLEGILVTRGEHGMTLVAKDREVLHLPTHAREVFDVTGAGDTVISVLAASTAAGEAIDVATRLSNISAGIVVGKLGTATVTESELRLALKREQLHDLGVVDEETLLLAVADAKQKGQRVVMTNGCFDILHAGHVAYLEQARKLGDRLIVAVNSDDSVRRLKGEKRPINSLADRMAVLAGLASVDWVVPFVEDTPERLICSVLPSMLVKGGDYKVEEIAGHQCILKNGGEVKVLTFIENVSTSGIISKIIVSSSD